jgi:hypothetical protein
MVPNSLDDSVNTITESEDEYDGF